MAIKNHAQNIAISILAILCLVLLFKGRTDRTEYDRAKKQLASDINQARIAEREAIKRVEDIQKQYVSLRDTTIKIGAGIDGATDSATVSTRLLAELRELLESIPDGNGERDKPPKVE